MKSSAQQNLLHLASQHLRFRAPRRRRGPCICSPEVIDSLQQEGNIQTHAHFSKWKGRFPTCPAHCCPAHIPGLKAAERHLLEAHVMGESQVRRSQAALVCPRLAIWPSWAKTQPAWPWVITYGSPQDLITQGPLPIPTPDLNRPPCPTFAFNPPPEKKRSFLWVSLPLNPCKKRKPHPAGGSGRRLNPAWRSWSSWRRRAAWRWAASASRARSCGDLPGTKREWGGGEGGRGGRGCKGVQGGGMGGVGVGKEVGGGGVGGGEGLGRRWGRVGACLTCTDWLRGSKKLLCQLSTSPRWTAFLLDAQPTNETRLTMVTWVDHPNFAAQALLQWRQYSSSRRLARPHWHIH